MMMMMSRKEESDRDGRICATKGGVDNMDKLVTAYSCERRTLS